MIAFEPQVENSARYSLRDTARVLGVSPSTVIRWTRAGHMRCTYRAINHRPTWSGAEIKRIWNQKC
jgi:predicted site-specific integrase-resolvase